MQKAVKVRTSNALAIGDHTHDRDIIIKSHLDGLGIEYDPAEVTSFVKEKMQTLDQAGTRLPL